LNAIPKINKTLSQKENLISDVPVEERLIKKGTEYK